MSISVSSEIESATTDPAMVTSPEAMIVMSTFVFGVMRMFFRGRLWSSSSFIVLIEDIGTRGGRCGLKSLNPVTARSVFQRRLHEFRRWLALNQEICPNFNHRNRFSKPVATE